MSEQLRSERANGLTERRQRRQNLTDKQVLTLPRKRQRYVKADPELRGHYLRVPPSGPVVFAAVARDPYNKQVWATLGTTDDLTIDQARERAREVIRRLKDGKPAFEPVPVKPDSYEAVAAKWLELYVGKKGLRSQYEIERLLRNFVLPVWGKRDFVSIRRSDISKLLDSIETDSAWNADHVLAIIRKIAKWHATRDENYNSPFVEGMRRTRSEERERDRILNDDELRKVWRQAEANGVFGALVRVLLLTAQRRGAVVGMKWDDLKDGVWEIDTEERMKGTADAVQLPAAALAAINALPKFKSNPFVFAAARGPGALNGFNKRKAAFDKACGVTGWTLHDLRRTARSLMSRAGVSDEHAEHTLGHKLQGVKRVYNRYDFFKEKNDALAKLATLIDRIVVPPEANVVPLQQPAAKRRKGR
jgi:integrase